MGRLAIDIGEFEALGGAAAFSDEFEHEFARSETFKGGGERGIFRIRRPGRIAMVQGGQEAFCPAEVGAGKCKAFAVWG